MNSIEPFLKGFGNDIHYNIDENSLSVAVGCELNFVEVEKIRHIISKYYNQFIVVNTCAVHDRNLNTSIKIVDRILEEYPTKLIFIVGCAYKEFKHLELQKSNVFVIDNAHKLLDEFYYSLPYAKAQQIPKPETQIGRIKIQDGCDFQCSYCVIPQLRGKSVSVSFDKIKEQIQANLDAGIRDLVLVGVNITLYVEPEEGFNLLELTYKILETYKDYEFTLTFDSLDPASLLLSELIGLIKTQDKLKKEIYLATQSGSDKVLKSMHRCHTHQRVLNLVNLAKGLKIRHDFIVGFPGETDEDFNETLQLMRLTQDENNYGVISKFTSHPNTEASSLPQLTPSLIDFRYRTLLEKKNRIINMIRCGENSLFITEVKSSELDRKKIKELMKQLQEDEIKEIRIIDDSTENIELDKALNMLNQVKVNYQQITVVNNDI